MADDVSDFEAAKKAKIQEVSKAMSDRSLTTMQRLEAANGTAKYSKRVELKSEAEGKSITTKSPVLGGKKAYYRNTSQNSYKPKMPTAGPLPRFDNGRVKRKLKGVFGNDKRAIRDYTAKYRRCYTKINGIRSWKGLTIAEVNAVKWDRYRSWPQDWPQIWYAMKSALNQAAARKKRMKR